MLTWASREVKPWRKKSPERLRAEGPLGSGVTSRWDSVDPPLLEDWVGIQPSRDCPSVRVRATWWMKTTT